jgi:hypothetical protein
MSNSSLRSDQNRQYAALACLSIAIAGSTIILARSPAAPFERYFGKFEPLAAIALVIGIGFIALGLLQTRGIFEIFRGRSTLQGIALSAIAATVFGMVAIVADLFIRFPADMNAPLPHALLFYPVMGYTVEVVFHALPLALLLVGLAPLLGRAPTGRLVWVSLFLAALLEPTLQLSFEAEPISWAGAFVWAHVFAINLAQLIVFRRYDFFSMYALRLIYYLYWHIIWGTLRLEVLF